MTANLIVHNDPFRPLLNMDQREIPHGLTINETLINAGFCFATEDGIVRTCPFFVIVEGKAVLQADWNTVLNHEDFVHISRLPAGGGGGSNVGSILGAIVIAVAAYFTFGLSLVAAAAVGVGAFAALSLVGQMAPTSSLSSDMSGSSSSPTYSLNAQGNTARLLEAMPRVYGRMRTYPDLAAQPYSEYEGNEQYLYQLFCISLGQISVEGIYFDDANITDFPDASYQIIQPGQAVTLFPDNVVTSDSVTGQTLLAPNEVNFSVVGPYTVVPSGKTANKISVDLLNPSGVGYVDDLGKTQNFSVDVLAEIRNIDNQGNPTSAWSTLFTKTISAGSTTALYTTVTTVVADGRYQVQLRRTSSKNLDSSGATNNRYYDVVQWVGVRAYLSSTYIYGNCTLLAVKARATNSLNSTTARKLSVVSTGLVQAWDPVNGFNAYAPSTNPAWIAADILRDQDYGRGLPTSRLNMPQLYALSQVWAARGDQFNGVFDTTDQLWAALTQVLAVGRCIPMYYAGVIDFVRDDVQTMVKEKFSPHNMIANSFEVTYSFFDVDSPDHVVIQYIDGTTWETAEVTCALAGETALTPSTVEIKGITNRDQAYRLGMSMAAANRDRRRSISFSTLTEALPLTYNSLIRINHDVPQWGYSGRVLDFDVSNNTIHVSEKVTIDISAPNVMAFRAIDGSEYGPFVIESDLSDNVQFIYKYKLTLSASEKNGLLSILSDGIIRDYTYFSAGPTERQGIKALVRSVKPDQDGRSTVTCVNYAESVYTAENGGVVPTPPQESNLPNIPQAPIVDSVSVAYTVVVGEQNIIATPARGAIYYEFQAMKAGTNTWAILGTQEMPTLLVHLDAGDWSVRVRGIARNVGPWATWSGTILATSLPTAKLDSFTATSAMFSILLQWTYSADSISIAASVEIYAGITNVLGNASKLVSLPYPANAYTIYNLEPGERRYLWARVIDTAGRIGAWFNNAAPITQIATNDPSKLLTILGGQITKTQLSQALATEIEQGGEQAQIQIDAIKTSLAAMYTIKTQLTVNGIPYTAGLGIGVENNNGIITSQILFRADTFAMINPNSGAYATPFIIKGNNTYIASAFIETLTVTNALIGATLSSVATDSSGNPLIVLNMQTGAFTLRSQNGNLYTVYASTGLKMTDLSTGVVVLEAGQLS